MQTFEDWRADWEKMKVYIKCKRVFTQVMDRRSLNKPNTNKVYTPGMKRKQ